MAELSLWLDYYDDIYSDFDSRHYLKRRVSEDFLYELRQAIKYRKERITELLLYLPQDKREESNERSITESLKLFFRSQFDIQAVKCRSKFNHGLIFGIVGIVIMVVNTIFVLKASDTLPIVAIGVLLEPAGWFLLWASFDFLFNDWKTLKNEREFFRELSEIKIHFKPE